MLNALSRLLKRPGTYTRELGKGKNKLPAAQSAFVVEIVFDVHPEPF